MDCREVQILLASRRDLSLAQRLEVDAHVRRCSVCAEALRAEERTSRLLQTLPGSSAYPPERVGAALRERLVQRTRAQQWGRRLALAGSLAATLLVGLLLLGIVTGGNGAWLAWQALDRLGVRGAIPTGGQPAAQPGSLYVVSLVAGEARQVRLTALDEATRRERFVFQADIAEPSARFDKTGHSALVDSLVDPAGARLFLAFPAAPAGDDVLVALDQQTGVELWRATIVRELHPPALVSRLAATRDSARIAVWSRPDDQMALPSGAQSPSLVQFRAATSGAQLPGAIRLAAIDMPALLVALPTGDIAVGLVSGRLLFFDREAVAVNPARSTSTPAVSLDVAVVGAALLSEGRRLITVSPDLTVTEIDIVRRAVLREIDLEPRGYFFFNADLLAFSADGATLAVGRRTPAADGNGLITELRVYATDTWREISRAQLDMPLVSLALNPDGAQAYAAVGSWQPQSTLAEVRGSDTLVIIDTATATVTAQWTQPGEQITRVFTGP